MKIPIVVFIRHVIQTLTEQEPGWLEEGDARSVPFGTTVTVLIIGRHGLCFVYGLDLIEPMAHLSGTLVMGPISKRLSPVEA